MVRGGSLGLFSLLVLFLGLLPAGAALASPTTTTTVAGPTSPAGQSAPPITAPPFPTPEEQQQVLDQARAAAQKAEAQAKQLEDLSSQIPGGLPAADEARRHAAEVQERMAEMQTLTDSISGKQGQVLQASAELDVMDDELSAIVEEYNLRSIELEEARYDAERVKDELATAQQQLRLLEQSLRDRVVGTYKSDSSTLEILLDTTDLKDFIRRITLMVSVARDDRKKVDEMAALRARADRLLDELSRQIYDVTLASQRLEEQKQTVEAKMAERQAFIDKLSAEIRTLVDKQRDLAQNLVPAGVNLASFLTGDGSAVVKTALQYLGVPYVWGGETPAGFDCSGLVMYVFREHGVYLPHYSRYQATMGYAVPRDQAAPGDLVFFGNPVHHVGIYMGDDLYVQAPRTGDVVKVSRLSGRNDLTHIRRFTFASATASLTGPGAPGAPLVEPVTAN